MDLYLLRNQGGDVMRVNNQIIFTHGVGYALSRFLMKRFMQRFMDAGYPESQLLLLTPYMETKDFVDTAQRYEFPVLIGHSMGGIKTHEALRYMDRNFTTQIIPKAFIVCSKTFGKSPFRSVGKLYNYTIPGDMLGGNCIVSNKYQGDNAENITLNRLTNNHLTVLGNIFEDVLKKIEEE